MSEPLRIALVAEGPTDGIVLEAFFRAMLHPRPFILKQIFPEGSMCFGPFGGGWAGVYRWCRQAAKRGGGRLENDALVFANFDILVVHLDADVASAQYSEGGIVPDHPFDGGLPCEAGCPPPSDTTNALRKVLLSWCGEIDCPSKVVLCVPSKSMEAWVVAALFPDDAAMKVGIECYQDPETRLSQQPIRTRLKKRKRDYREQMERFEAEWSRIAAPTALSEACRFRSEFLACVQAYFPHPPEP